MQTAEKITLPDVEITVVAVDSEGVLTEVLFEFAVELGDKSLYWLEFNWQDGLYHPFEVSKVGHSCEVSGPPVFSRRDAIKFILNEITR